MAGPVRDIDLGWKRILREARINGVKKPAVTIGIQGKEARIRREGGINQAGLGTVHEFGTLDDHIPERSFLRATVDRNRAKYQRLMRRLGNLVVVGRITLPHALALLGEQVKSDIQSAFEDGLEPPLAESTKAMRTKGSGEAAELADPKPLIDTAQLKNSITYQVRGFGQSTTKK